MSDLASRQNAWIVGSDSGASSKAIWAHMMGAGKPKSFGWSYPLDPSDIGRCFRLLDLIPEWRSRLGEMAAHSREWANLVANWDRIRAAMEDEVGVDWSKGHNAPKTYALMRSVLYPDAGSEER